MSVSHDGLVLQHQELAALLALGGRRQIFGYRPSTEVCTEHELWSACCRLMAEGMMTQTEGRFQLCKGLYEVVVPILQADKALVLRKQAMEPSVIYYLGRKVVSVESTIFGRYSMCMLEITEAVEDIMTQRGIRCYDGAAPVIKDSGLVEPEQTAVHQLIEKSSFFLALTDTNTGTILAWLRGTPQWAEPFLEITDRTGTRRSIMTQENLRTELTQLLGG